MDVVILCGGYGSRLISLWNGPKCLVPLADDKPIIDHILRRIPPLRPRQITLITGFRGNEVKHAVLVTVKFPVVFIHETFPMGTANAIRFAMHEIQAPVLILNGDTLPLYNLNDIVSVWSDDKDSVSGWTSGKQAGARILGQHTLDQLRTATNPDLDYWLIHGGITGVHQHFGVHGFLDIGTPSSFALGRKWLDSI